MKTKVPHLEKILLALAIILLAVFTTMQYDHPQREIYLANAIEEKFGPCDMDCEELIIHNSEKFDLSYDLEVIYHGLRDDSVFSKKYQMIARYKDEKWYLEDPHTTEFICQPGRGQQEFMANLCL